MSKHGRKKLMLFLVEFGERGERRRGEGENCTCDRSPGIIKKPASRGWWPAGPNPKITTSQKSG